MFIWISFGFWIRCDLESLPLPGAVGGAGEADKVGEGVDNFPYRGSASTFEGFGDRGEIEGSVGRFDQG